jgi:hypothetical protein
MEKIEDNNMNFLRCIIDIIKSRIDNMGDLIGRKETVNYIYIYRYNITRVSTDYQTNYQETNFNKSRVGIEALE